MDENRTAHLRCSSSGDSFSGDRRRGSGIRAARVATRAARREFWLTAYPTFVRDGENYTSAIAVADRGPLHLEARYNYEPIGARSAFAGWTVSGGESFTWGRDIQRGPFAQVTSRSVTIGGYWFNPGSSDQILVGLIGVSF